MNKFIIFVFFSYIVSLNSYNLINYRYGFLEYDLELPIYTNISFCQDSWCETLRDIEPFTFTCTDKSCTMNLTQTMMDNFYGAGLIGCYITDNNARECFHNVNYLPDPVDVVAHSNPSTQGGIVQITGGYLRIKPVIVTSIFYRNNGKFLESKIIDDVFKATNLHLSFPPGYGSMLLYFDVSGDQNLTLKYASPIISNVNYSNSIIEIVGNNFYNDSSVAKITINNQLIDSKIIASINHTEIKINYLILYAGVYQIGIDIGGNSLTEIYNYKKLAEPSSINIPNVSISKYNGGVITIKGSFMSSSSNSSKTNVTLVGNKSYNCLYQSSTQNQIVCYLESGYGTTNQIIVNIDGLESISNIPFTYGKPNITPNGQSGLQDGSKFTINGLNFGKLSDNSTTVLVNGSDVGVTILSIGDDEKSISFILPKSVYGSVEISLKVNGLISNSIVFALQPAFDQVITYPSTIDGSSLILSSFYSRTYVMKSAYITIDSSTIQHQCNISKDTATCKVGPGTGIHSFKAFIDSSTAPKITGTFQYASPNITSYKYDFYDNGKINITLIGSNFGIDSSKCSITFENDSNSCHVIEDDIITFEINRVLYGNLNITIDSLVSNNQNVKAIGDSCLIGSQLNTTNGYCLLSNHVNTANNVTIVPGSHSNINLTYTTNVAKLIIPNGVDSFKVDVYFGSNYYQSIVGNYFKPVVIDWNVQSVTINETTDQLFVSFYIYGYNFGSDGQYTLSFDFYNNNQSIANNCSLSFKNGYEYINCTGPLDDEDDDGNVKYEGYAYLQVGKYPTGLVKENINLTNKVNHYLDELRLNSSSNQFKLINSFVMIILTIVVIILV